MIEASRDSSGVRFPPPAIYVIGLLVGFGVDRLWPLRIVRSGQMSALRLAGISLAAAGVALAAWALYAFRSVGTSPLPIRPTTAIASRGPYRFTRNPMYLGMAALSAGVALLANALWPLLMLIVVLGLVQAIVILPEERYLERKFGNDYRVYKTKVRRWL